MYLTGISGEGTTPVDYMVHFQFLENVPLELHRKGQVVTTNVRGVLCTIHPGRCTKQERPCDTPGSISAMTLCSPRDKFIRWTGRQQAFTRALAAYADSHILYGYRKSFRAAMWERFKVKNPPPKGGRK